MQQLTKAVEGKVIPFPRNAPTLPEQEIYHPNICYHCKCELAPGVHGYLRGPYDQIRNKSTLINCPVCTVEAQQQAAMMQQNALIARLFNGSHLPYGSRHWSFETFPRGADQEALSVVRNFVTRWRYGDEDGKRGLFLGNEPGRCKTSLAISALKDVMQSGGVGLFVSVADLIKKIQATYNRNSEVSESDLLNTVYTVPWLVLDDLGVEKPSEFVVTELYLIIDKRRMAGLWTIITSNLNTKALAKRLSPKDLSSGDFDPAIRVVERIRESYEGIEVQGRNMRAARTQEGKP